MKQSLCSAFLLLVTPFAWALDAPVVRVSNTADGVSLFADTAEAVSGFNLYRDDRYESTHFSDEIELTNTAGKLCVVAWQQTDAGVDFSRCSGAVVIDTAAGSGDADAPTGSDSALPGPPLQLRAQRYSRSAGEIFWQAATLADVAGSIARYQVFRNNELVAERDARSYFDASIRNLDTVDYAVRAVTAAGGVGAMARITLGRDAGSNPNGGAAPDTGGEGPVVPGLAPAVSLRHEIYSSTAAELFWEPAASSTAGQFEIVRDGNLLARSDARSWFESDLQPGRRYVYDVYALNTDGERSTAATLELLAGGSAAGGDSAAPPEVQPPDVQPTEPPPVDEPPAAGDALQLQVPTRLPVLTEGTDQPTRIEISLSRPGARLSVREEAGSAAVGAAPLSVWFDKQQLDDAETVSGLNLLLPLGAAPIQTGSRRLVVTAEQGGDSASVAIDIEVQPGSAPDVYLLIGQSNMVGFSGENTRLDAEGEADAPDPRIWQLHVRPNNLAFYPNQNAFASRESNIAEPDFIQAQHPLHEPLFPGAERKGAAYIGPGLAFAKAALANTNARVYLVPAAWSGTGFCGDGPDQLGWNAYPSEAPYLAGRQLADRAIARLNMTLANTGGILRGILWHQGEADSNDVSCVNTYRENLRQLVQRIRSEALVDGRGDAARGADAAVPFIVATMSRGSDGRGDLSAFGDLKNQIDSVHRTIAIDVPHSGYVNADDLIPPAYACGAGSCIHFGAAAYREMGKRYYRALLDVLASM